MSVNQTFNSVVYPIPVEGDLRWGPPLTRYLVALGTGAISPSGGTYTLTADLNFGNNFGLLAAYYKSGGSNIATAGRLRLSNTDLIEWRNFANGGNNTLGVNASDLLVYNGTAIQPAITLLNGEIWIGNASNLPIGRTLSGAITTTNTGVTSISTDYITNAMVNSTAAIAYSKLNLTGSIVNADIFSGAAIAYSKLALTGSIVNADINASAAIAYSKLALSNSIVNADINTSAAIAYSKLNLSASIVNADIATAAAIAFSKLATLTNTHILVGSAGGVATDVAVSGDATLANTGALTLATVNGNVGSFGSSTSIPSFTVNGKGLITAASGNVVIAPAGTLTGTTLAANVVTSSLTAVGTLTSGTWNASTITVPNGGTGTTSFTAYAVLTAGTTSTNPVQSIASVGTSGQVLTSNGAGLLPTFQTSTASGVVNAGTAGQVAYYAASAAAVSGTSAFTVGATGPNGIIVGTNTNNSAAAGVVGEYIASTTTSTTNVAASGTYDDLLSISLTAGDWDVSGLIYFTNNGATWSQARMAITATSGNSATGLDFGINGNIWVFASTSVVLTDLTLTMPVFRVSLSGTTTYYLKRFASFSIGTPQSAGGRISARRVR